MSNGELVPNLNLTEAAKLDSRSILLLKTMLPDNMVDCRQLQEGGTLPNIDGYLDLLCDDGTAREKVVVQVKHLTCPEIDGNVYYSIPHSIYAYAERHKGELVIFIACDDKNRKFYWRNINSAAIEEFKNKSNHIQSSARYHFLDSEKCSADSVADTIQCWRKLYHQKEDSIRDEKQQADNFAALQKSYFNTISTELHGISNSHIVRHQVSEINRWIDNDTEGQDKHICLLVGDAGVGKSAVLKEVIDSLNKKNCKCLCIKADSIDDSGNNITLEKIRDTIEFYSVGKEKVLLIVDQIDALSQCLSNDRNHLNVMMTALSSLKDWPNVRAIVSCRNYDLDYDSDLCSLKDNAKRIDIGQLTEEEVTRTLEKIDKGLLSKLDNTTYHILKTVHYLNVFCILYKRRKTELHFGNLTELYDAIWDEYIIKSAVHLNPDALEQVLFQITETARKTGTLRPTLTPTTKQKQLFDYLASCGLIKIDGGSVTFFHQSFYDYVLARQYTSSGKTLFNDIKNTFQSLELRQTVKAVLEYERGHNRTLFVDEVHSILSSDSVRLHIKLLAISVLAFTSDPLPAEKQLIKDACKKDEKLLLYFLRGVQYDSWFATVWHLVEQILPDLKKDNLALFPIIGCLSRFVFRYPVDVYDLVNAINDTETKSISASYMLRSHNDYRQECVLKAYRETKTLDINITVELIKDAFQTNEKFAFDETEALLVNYFTSEGKESRLDGYELVDVLSSELFNNHPKNFLLTLNNAIVQTIEQSSYEGHYGFTCTKVFNDSSLDDYTSKLLTMYENLLVRFSSDSEMMRPIIENLMALRNETSVSMAFSVIAANPKAYDDIIRPLVADNQSINKYLSGDVEFFYLKMIKSWYLTLGENEAVMYQRQVLSYKSPIDLGYDKERRRNKYLCPLLWRNKWVLICNTLPEDGLIPEMKKCSFELLRRFDERLIVEREEHTATAAYYCGGLVSDEKYAKFSHQNWLKSFLKLDENQGWRDGLTPISLDEHANAFKRCVIADPVKFRNFIFELFRQQEVKEMYKVAGLEGLLESGENPLSLWTLAESFISVQYAKKNSYSFRQIADYFIKSENPHLDEVLKVAETLSIIPLDERKHYNSSEGDTKDIKRRATKLIERAINSYQGRAVELLIHTCSLPERRAQAYGIISKLQADFSEPLKTLPLHYLYVKDSFDKSLYFPLMKQLLTDLGPEALFIRTDAIQYCFYHRNEIVKDYIDRIESDPASHEIIAQIYFYGLSRDTIRDDCRLRLDKILSNNEENVIAKLVEAAMKSYCHPEMKEYAVEILRRFAADNRDSIANAYCWHCNSLPVEAFDMYCSIAKSFTDKKYRKIHGQLKYIKKCVAKYPKKCYKFISDQKYSEIGGPWIADDDVVRVLLQIYNKLKENEDEESMNEIMNLFDDYIYRENRIIMDAMGKMS